jgi:hypothetical protein
MLAAVAACDDGSLAPGHVRMNDVLTTNLKVFVGSPVNVKKVAVVTSKGAPARNEVRVGQLVVSAFAGTSDEGGIDGIDVAGGGGLTDTVKGYFQDAKVRAGGRRVGRRHRLVELEPSLRTQKRGELHSQYQSLKHTEKRRD